MVMGRSQVMQEAEERKERGRSLIRQSPGCRRGRKWGISLQEETPPPVHPGCRKVSGWGWLEGEGVPENRHVSWEGVGRARAKSMGVLGRKCFSEQGVRLDQNHTQRSLSVLEMAHVTAEQVATDHLHGRFSVTHDSTGGFEKAGWNSDKGEIQEGLDHLDLQDLDFHVHLEYHELVW